MENHSLNIVIDEIISDLGYYSPVELLLRQGRLRFTDYEEWRYGRTELLTDKFMGSARRINSLLKSAEDYVIKLEFAAEPAEFYGWKGSKVNQLLVFGDVKGEIDLSLLCTQFRRKQSAPQLDLFFDNQSVQIANELVQALADRNIELAELKLNQLEHIDPGHALCGQAVKLITALQRLEAATELPQPAQQLDDIRQHLLPLAKEILQGRTRDFIAPFWRQLALNINTDSYSDQQQDLHPAYCYTQILQWPEVISSIYSTENWRQFSALYKLLSQALYQNNQRNESIQLLCDFCWSFPQQQPDFILDAHSSKMYFQFIDLELDETWGWLHFPAWLLIHEPGLAIHIKEGQPNNSAAFSVLLKLLHSIQTGSHQNMQLRSDLKLAHNGIFSYFLEKFSQH